ncbi:hypothetical protein ABZ863_03130 [Saccharomonospora sp. NPDC046836]|uniref:hypothetical protein n=1 Tax=Saccharomonospora sp. NPDC046836 TaxID=3156921 RepID=UPI0034099B35
MSGELVKSLLERTARALPAWHVADLDGWWLRHSPGCSWWVGTVLPHSAASPEDLAKRIGGAEQFYASRNAAARFQISPGACPAELDAVLAERGYRRHSVISLQVASTAQVVAPPGSLRVRPDDQPTRPWFESWNAVQGHVTDARMLHRVEQPPAYASALRLYERAGFRELSPFHYRTAG